MEKAVSLVADGIRESWQQCGGWERLLTVWRMGKAGNLCWKMGKAGNRLADRKDRLVQTGQQFHFSFCAEK